MNKQSFLIIISITFLSACVSTSEFSNHVGENTAFLKVPTPYKERIGFFMNTQDVHIYDLNDKGCSINRQEINADNVPSDKIVKVKAGEEIILSISTMDGNSQCKAGIVATLEKGKSYVMEARKTVRKCSAILSEKLSNGELKTVYAEPAKQNVITTDFCKD